MSIMFSRYNPYERPNNSNKNRPYFRENIRGRNEENTDKGPWSRNDRYNKSFSNLNKSSNEIVSDADSLNTITKCENGITIILPNTISSNVPLNVSNFQANISESPFQSSSDNNDETVIKTNIFSRICLKQTNYYMFNKMNTVDTLKMVFLYGAARCVYDNEESDHVIPVIAAAEYISVYLPDNKVIHGRDADLFFKKVMSKAITDFRFNKKIKPNEELYETLAEIGMSRKYPPDNPENITGEQYMNILRALTKCLNPWHANCDLVVILTAIIPCVLKEKLTTNFTKNVEKIIFNELKKKIVINSVSMDLFFKNFVAYMEDDNINEMVILLRSALPKEEVAPRLVDLLRRKPGGGLLPITLIGKALKECPDFPWRSTMDLYPNDWRGVDKAIRVIGGNKFYGYLKIQSSDIDPKNYQNLAWIAKSLCEQKLNDNYDDYDEWIKIPQKEDEANMLISEYLHY